MFGPPGTGKTHICASVIGDLGHQFRYIRAFNERNFFGRLREGMDKYVGFDYIQEIKQMIDGDLFIYDDLGSAGHTQWREEVLMELIDACYSRLMPMIVTTNLSPEELKKTYGERIHSRLFSIENTIIDLTGYPDMRMQPRK